MELMRLKGINGTMIAYEDRIEIERKGLTTYAFFSGAKGNKTFFYSDLTSIGYKKPGINGGYFQFITPGSNPSAPKFDLVYGPTRETQQDENVVLLSWLSDSEKAEQFYQLIFEKISEAKDSHVPVTSTQSGADEIKKYNDLYKQGIITEDEFIAAKKKILGL